MFSMVAGRRSEVAGRRAERVRDDMGLPSERESLFLQAARREAKARETEWIWQAIYRKVLRAHRDEPLLPADGEDGVVAAWSPCGRIDEEVDDLVGYGRRVGLGEHDVQIGRLKDLLEGVEGEPTQFAFDEVWPVLHNGLEFEVPVAALPARDEVQHVGALRRLAVFSALGAGEGDAEGSEHGEVGGLVAHAEEAREEVDLARDGGDGQEARGPDDEEREYCLVGEAGVDVGGLLQDDDVAPRALGR